MEVGDFGVVVGGEGGENGCVGFGLGVKFGVGFDVEIFGEVFVVYIYFVWVGEFDCLLVGRKCKGDVDGGGGFFVGFDDGDGGCGGVWVGVDCGGGGEWCGNEGCGGVEECDKEMWISFYEVGRIFLWVFCWVCWGCVVF